MTASRSLSAVLANRRLRIVAATLLFAAALGVRLVYLQQLEDTAFADERGLIVDAKYYDMRAREIARGELVGEVPAYLSPFYCDVLGLTYFLLGPRLDVAKLLQAVLGALSCLLVYRIGARAFSEAVGLLAGGVLAFYGLHVYLTGLLLPAVLVLFLNLLALYVLIRAPDEASPLRFLLAGVFIGLAAATKSNALLLLPFTLIWIWWAFGGLARRRRAAWSLALLLGATLAIAPTTIRNHLSSGDFVLLTTTGGVNLLKGNGPHANGTHVFLPDLLQGIHLGHYLQRTVSPRQAIDHDRKLRQRAIDHVISHPVPTLRLWAKKLFLFFHSVELGIRDQFYFARDHYPSLSLAPLGFGLVAPIGVVGAFSAWRRRRSRIVHLFLLAQMLSFVLIFVLARYRLVAVGCLILFASWQTRSWILAARERRWRQIAPSLLAAILVGVLMHIPLSEFPKDRRYAYHYAYLGDHHFGRSEHGRAIVAYQRALQSEWRPWTRDTLQRWSVIFRLGISQMRTERLAQAERTFERLLAEWEETAPDELADRKRQVRGYLETIRKQRASSRQES